MYPSHRALVTKWQYLSTNWPPLVAPVPFWLAEFERSSMVPQNRANVSIAPRYCNGAFTPLAKKGDKGRAGFARLPLDEELMVNSQFVQILALMQVGHRMLRQRIETEAKPKGMFAVFKRNPDPMMVFGMVQGYEAALVGIENCEDEDDAAESLVASIESFEATARISTTTVAESVQSGMSKGAVWALGDFHGAMKSVHGGGYILSNGHEKLVSEILRRHGLHKLI